MKKVVLVGGFILLFFVAMFVVASQWPDGRKAGAAASPSAITPAPGITPSTAPATDQPGFLYGRVTLTGGDTLEGRLRWGRGEEAFWGDAFNGVKGKNVWAAQVPADRLPKESTKIEIFGLDLVHQEKTIDLGRRFLTRFGDIARIEAHGRDVRVTLKSGTVFELDRFESSDFDDDLRVWDGTRGVVDLDSMQISAIDLLPTAPLADAPGRLHGTVHTPQGDFTGFIQWDRTEGAGTDELDGLTAEGELSVRFDTIRSIVRGLPGCAVTLLDGRTIELSGREVGRNNRGIYVEDPRYGRVLISWDAFERVDFSPSGTGPAYGDFPPGSPLKGAVTKRDGRRIAGRLVFDLDESETTETLDGPAEGVDYTLPFGLVASIVPPGPEEGRVKLARVTLHNGEELQLERSGDFGDLNAGMLVFVDGGQTPEYVSWGDIGRVDLDRPPAMYPPLNTTSKTKKE